MKRMLFFLLIGLSGYSFSQSLLLDIQSSQFDHVFGFDFRETTGGYLIAGTGGTNSNSEFFCWLTKTDAAFNTVWSKKFPLSGNTYQVNSSTITISTFANDQIILLAKTRDEDSVYTELTSFDQNGNFLWGKKWVNPFGYSETVDMNKIVTLSNIEFQVSHSVLQGNTHLKLDTDGNVLSSKYTHLTNLNDTVLGISNLLCTDGGMFHILQSHSRRTVLLKMNGMHQIEWAKEIQSFNRYVRMVTAFENSDGSFWVFGSITPDQSSPQLNQSLSVMKVTGAGNLLGVYHYNQFASGISMGIAQIYPAGPNTFDFNTTEAQMGTINLNTGVLQAEQLDIFQANHGFQNLHKPNGTDYVLTGMGANWVESKIHIFPAIADHPCLQVFLPMQTVSQDTIPLSEMQVTDVAAVCDNYSTGNAFNPLVETADISLSGECSLGLEENTFDFEISLYPNPAASNEFVTLKLNGKYAFEKMNLAVFDLQGNRVYYSELDGNTDSQTIDTRLFCAGMYFVNCDIPGNSKNFTSKLVIH